MDSLIVGAIGVMLGFLLSVARDRRERRRRHTAFWAALLVESDCCRQLAERYLDEGSQVHDVKTKSGAKGIDA